MNLNKAVVKWLRQEGRGEITQSQIVDHIRNSNVAQQLRILHGQEFDEDHFVLDALTHAKQKKI